MLALRHVDRGVGAGLVDRERGVPGVVEDVGSGLEVEGPLAKVHPQTEGQDEEEGKRLHAQSARGKWL